MTDESAQYPGLVLMYHGVDPGDGRFENLSAGERAYCLSAELFKRHLERIEASVYHIGDPRKASHPAPRTIWLSFDDGWSSDYDIVMPLLAGNEQTGIFFVTTDWVNQRGHVSWEALGEMERAGMCIGSHGASHALMEALPADRQYSELHSSREVLESGLGHPVSDLSLPGGSLNESTVKEAVKAGYSRVFTSSPGDFRKDEQMAVVGRIAVRRDWDADALGAFLKNPRPMLESIACRTRWKRRVRNWIGPRWYKGLHDRFWKR